MPYESRLVRRFENTSECVVTAQKSHLTGIFHLFSAGLESTFSTLLAISCTSSSLLLEICKAQGACVALSANAFLFAAAYHARRDAGRCLGLLAL
jgi:hypothetical protein